MSPCHLVIPRPFTVNSPPTTRPFPGRIQAEERELDSLLIIVVIVFLLWVGVLAYYFYVTNRQEDIRADIEAVKRLLEKDGQEERDEA